MPVSRILYLFLAACSGAVPGGNCNLFGFAEQAATIHLGPALPRDLGAAYLGPGSRRNESRGGQPAIPAWPCSGWGLPSHPGLPGCWWSLTPPFHPCRLVKNTNVGGLFSVALSVGSRRLGVTQHPALWSPDFPPTRFRVGSHPTYSLSRAYNETRRPVVPG